MNRYYGSNLGRFLTPDPFGGSAKPTDPQTWNRYAYVGNDPGNRTDASGLDSECFWTGEGIVCLPVLTGDFTVYGYAWIFALVEAYYAANAPSQAAGAPVAPGIAVAQGHLRNIAQGGFKSKGQCRNFFAELIKQNGLDISVDTLMDQVQTTAAEAANYVYDGPSSTTLIDAEKFPGIDSAKYPTVGHHFAAFDGEAALSQFNGAAIWIRQAHWSGWMSSYTGNAERNQYGLGVLFHELLHKQTIGGGFRHDPIGDALLGVHATATSLGREWMSHNLGRICF